MTKIIATSATISARLGNTIFDILTDIGARGYIKALSDGRWEIGAGEAAAPSSVWPVTFASLADAAAIMGAIIGFDISALPFMQDGDNYITRQPTSENVVEHGLRVAAALKAAERSAHAVEDVLADARPDASVAEQANPYADDDLPARNVQFDLEGKTRWIEGRSGDMVRLATRIAPRRIVRTVIPAERLAARIRAEQRAEQCETMAWYEFEASHTSDETEQAKKAMEARGKEVDAAADALERAEHRLRATQKAYSDAYNYYKGVNNDLANDIGIRIDWDSQPVNIHESRGA